MAKKLSRTKLIKKLDTVFSQYIRQRDAVNEIATCFTCGKQDHWKKLQNGHFQSRRFYSTRWNEMNCQVQCAGCNVFKYGEQFVFGKNLDAKFGKGTSFGLHIKARKITKLSSPDIEELIDMYSNLVKEL
ncbi:MAG: recombination protein NinG [Wenyingzhuangia sp.]|uniref:recombination protein NinG n=1 Tax=Wenyingzhuangia sp. TaxID=1964193 RepID=UPI00321B9A09